MNQLFYYRRLKLYKAYLFFDSAQAWITIALNVYQVFE
jgi:hypothetical protein